MEEDIKSLGERMVIDASFVLAFLLPDEKNEFVDKVFDFYEKREIELFSSPILPFEIVNAIRSAVIQKRITSTQAQRLIQEFLDLSILLEVVELKKLFELALAKNLSVYDASYLYVSRKLQIEFLTLDRGLRS